MIRPKTLENIRQNVEDVIKKWGANIANSVPQETNEQEIIENIEEIPEEEEVKVSWLNKPRARNTGGFTNLSIEHPVEIRNNGGQIN